MSNQQPRHLLSPHPMGSASRQAHSLIRPAARRQLPTGPNSTRLPVYAAAVTLQPASQTAVTVAPSVSSSRPTNEPPVMTGPAFAPSAANRSQPASSATQPATAASAASAQRPNGDDAPDSGQSKSNDTVVPLNSRGYVVPPVIGHCAHCGTELTRKSRNGRLPQYCHTRCRVAAWRKRQQANKAQGGSEEK